MSTDKDREKAREIIARYSEAYDPGVVPVYEDEGRCINYHSAQSAVAAALAEAREEGKRKMIYTAKKAVEVGAYAALEAKLAEAEAERGTHWERARMLAAERDGLRTHYADDILDLRAKLAEAEALAVYWQGCARELDSESTATLEAQAATIKALEARWAAVKDLGNDGSLPPHLDEIEREHPLPGEGA